VWYCTVQFRIEQVVLIEQAAASRRWRSTGISPTVVMETEEVVVVMVAEE
jgi:hypothetical protein